MYSQFNDAQRRRILDATVGNSDDIVSMDVVDAVNNMKSEIRSNSSIYTGLEEERRLVRETGINPDRLYQPMMSKSVQA